MESTFKDEGYFGRALRRFGFKKSVNSQGQDYRIETALTRHTIDSVSESLDAADAAGAGAAGHGINCYVKRCYDKVVATIFDFAIADLGIAYEGISSTRS
jgi:hypothetical protein